MKDIAKNREKNFEFLVDKIPYQIKVIPEVFNDTQRFRIQVNGDDGHLYAWDRETVSLQALDDDAATLPNGLEKAISDKLVKTIVM
jgi:hypothetical protein